MLKWTHKTQLSTFVPFGSIPSFLSNLEDKRQICCDESPPIKFGDIFLPMNPRLPLISSKSVGFSEDIVQVVGLGFGFWWCGEGLGWLFLFENQWAGLLVESRVFRREKKQLALSLTIPPCPKCFFLKHFAICFRDSEEFGLTGIAGSASWNMYLWYLQCMHDSSKILFGLAILSVSRWPSHLMGRTSWNHQLYREVENSWQSLHSSSKSWKSVTECHRFASCCLE